MAKSRVSLRVIDPEKARVIRLQAALVRDEGFFLAGGIGLAVRLGHRLSADLDWFTPSPFNAGAIERRLEALAESPTQILRHGRHTVRAYYGTLETSFITYGQVPASPEIMKVAGTEIPVADIAIIAAMKAAALHDRGAKRDFIDIHAICSRPVGRSSVSSTTPRNCCRCSLSRLRALSPTSSMPRKSRCRRVTLSPGRKSKRTLPAAFSNGSKPAARHVGQDLRSPTEGSSA